MQGAIEAHGSSFSGMNLTIKGDNNTVSGMNAIVYGDNNTVSRMCARVYGNNNTVSGMWSKAYGYNNVVSGMNSQSFGPRAEPDEQPNRERRGGITIAGGVISGGLFQDNTKKEKKKKKKRKEPEPIYVEGPTVAELEHDKIVADEDNEKTCVICLTNKSLCAAVPCMHMSYCVKCARFLCFGEEDTLKQVGTVKCAECRAQVNAIKRIF